MINTNKEQELKDLFNSRFDQLDEKVTQLNTNLKVMKVDLIWIKWILGLSGSLIIVLLSVNIFREFYSLTQVN